MTESCRAYCPVYSECTTRLGDIAAAQRKVHSAASVIGRPEAVYSVVASSISLGSARGEQSGELTVDLSDDGTTFDPFREAALGEIAVSQAIRHCDGPKMNPAAAVVLGLSMYLDHKLQMSTMYFSSPELMDYLAGIGPRCSSRDAAEALRRVPVVAPAM